ncbi:hypothetical protein BVRB_4g073560 [Beta vulgaris subsp. vulgaris]|nr:hypothetical protein BVRB_4g073560 [Beta vulgaris subsp. vulgaris]
MELEKNPEEIREINFQSEGSILHYGQILEHCTLPELWNQLKLSRDFHRARPDLELQMLRLYILQKLLANLHFFLLPQPFLPSRMLSQLLEQKQATVVGFLLTILLHLRESVWLALMNLR